MCWPASAASCLPTGVEPVKVILRMIGCGIRYSGNLGRHAVHQVDHAGGHAGIDEGADQLGRRGRRLLRRLDDDRAARGQRGAQLAHHLVDREIPRRERGDRPDRLLDHHLVDAGCAGRDEAAVAAAAFLGEPLDDVGGGHGLDLGFGERLALLHGHDASAISSARSRISSAALRITLERS